MPTLDWIGKKAVVNHHNEVPYKTLELQYTYKDGKKILDCDESENMIIHGDNLEALKSLLPKYEGKINCIYIDPPYNTGEEGWCYNDNVNAPQINKWLGEAVGKEEEDLTRHDKWLCMMYPRLKMLYKLMSKDGIIFISIDDNEASNLKALCDSIFGHNCFVASFVWQKRYSRENREAIGDVHEYILVYALNKKKFKEERNLIPMNDVQSKVYKNPNNDPKGRWRAVPMTAQAGHATKDQFYPITAPGGKIHYPPEGRCWCMSETTFNELRNEGRIYFGADGNSQPNTIRYLSEVEGVVPWTWLPHEEVGNTDGAKKEIYSILEKNIDFATPKPSTLIERILHIATKPNSIILDSFAGSGTTAHAVLSLNKQDGGNRKFILIEMEDYAESTTAERVKRVIDGYPYKGKKEEEIYNQPLTIKNLAKASEYIEEANAISESKKGEYDKISNPKIVDNCIKVVGTKIYDEKMEGLGGDFSFYELGEPMITEPGFINENQPLKKIQEYIWYTETQSSFNKNEDEGQYHLGKYNDVSYYFFYKKNEATTLDVSFLNKEMKVKADQYVIYADNCLLSEELMKKLNIVFKKIPRDIRQF